MGVGMGRGIGRALGVAGLIGATAASGGCIIVVGEGWDDDDHHSYHSGHRAERLWTVEIDEALLSETDSLFVWSKAGDIEVEAGDGPARLELRAQSPSADRVEGVSVELVSEDGELSIRPLWPGGRWRSNESVDLWVVVPVRDGVTIETSAGDVEVSEMSGMLRVETSAGDVEVEDHSGPARVRSSAGDVWMEHVAGDIEAETSAGDIELHDVGWPIEAITSAGDVTVSMRPGFSGRLHAMTSAGDLRLPGEGEGSRQGSMRTATHTIGDPGVNAECVFKTSAGDVSVRVLSE